MLEWGSPLWFLAVPAVLLAAAAWRGPRLAWPALGAIQSRATIRTALAWLPKTLLAVGLLLIVVALARPQIVDRQRIVESEGIDILLVLDTSGSMEAEDYRLGGLSVSRLEVAKEVLARFVDGRADDRLGLVVFGQEAFTQVPLTTDHDALLGFLDQVQIGMAGERSTAIGDAIAVAGRRLESLEAPSKVVILLTDGRNNAGQIEPLQAAQALAALGVRVYTIGVGGEGGAGGGLFGMFGGRGGDLDERTLKAIASLTEGRYFRAQDTASLERVYETIDQLEKSTAESREYVHREERFLPFAIGGLLVLMIQLVLAETVLRRLP